MNWCWLTSTKATAVRKINMLPNAAITSVINGNLSWFLRRADEDGIKDEYSEEASHWID